MVRLKARLKLSLSARRAWIEINTRNQPGKPKAVALRKESVDRNIVLPKKLYRTPPSLSARRAWIEITVVGVLATLVTASLSARRAWIEIYKHRIHHKEKKSLSARRAWIEIDRL